MTKQNEYIGFLTGKGYSVEYAQKSWIEYQKILDKTPKPDREHSVKKQRLQEVDGKRAKKYRDMLEDRRWHHEDSYKVEPWEPETSNPDYSTSYLDALNEDKARILESVEYELVLKVLPELTSRQREVLRIVGYEGRSYDEAAQLLNITRQAINSTIQAIRKKVKRQATKFPQK